MPTPKSLGAQISRGANGLAVYIQRPLAHRPTDTVGTEIDGCSGVSFDITEATCERGVGRCNEIDSVRRWCESSFLPLRRSTVVGLAPIRSSTARVAQAGDGPVRRLRRRRRFHVMRRAVKRVARVTCPTRWQNGNCALIWTDSSRIGIPTFLLSTF
jgi:hypothetical protein